MTANGELEQPVDDLWGLSVFIQRSPRGDKFLCAANPLMCGHLTGDTSLFFLRNGSLKDFRVYKKI